MKLLGTNLLVVCSWLLVAANSATCADLQTTIRNGQRKIVKLYGAGGFRQMEAYQSGILVSPEGHILTAMSYVLDTDDLVAVLDDGRKLRPEIIGTDPVRELAVLAPEELESGLPYFDLSQSVSGHAGQRVLALSNLYGIATGDEPASALQGVVTAVAPLDARRGAQRMQFRDTVYIIDAQANNPGAAGGALIDWQGRLVGVLGKEVRSRMTGTWLHYALPAREIAPVVADILAGRELSVVQDNSVLPENALNSAMLGFMTVPDVLRRTPPYVDTVIRNSLADEQGLRADDLVVFVGDRPIASCRELVQALARYEQDEPVSVSVLRDGKLFVFQLDASMPKEQAEVAPKEGISQ